MDSPTGNGQVRVLIVDDSVVIRQRLSSMLAELAGVAVVGEAVDGREGLELTESLGPDVVFVDIRMPGIGGIELLGRLKTDKAAPIVIVLTNYPYPAYQKRCRELGADYFFDKSTEFEAAIDVLRGLVAGAR